MLDLTFNSLVSGTECRLRFAEEGFSSPECSAETCCSIIHGHVAAEVFSTKG